jgi:hypothetical protein
VVKALCYKPEGHGFETQTGEGNFFNLPTLSGRITALESTQPLTEMSTRNLPRDKGWPACKANNSPPSMSLLSRQCEILNISQPYRPSRPVTGIALLLVILPAALGWPQPLTEMSTRNLPRDKGTPASKADNLTAFSDPDQSYWHHPIPPLQYPS